MASTAASRIEQAAPAFRQGRRAYRAGNIQNPYPPSSYAHALWAQGWRYADDQASQRHARDEFDFERNYTNPE